MHALPDEREDGIARDGRAPFRPFAVSVRGLRRVGAHLTRVTFTGPELHLFGRDGLDQRVKVLFPLPGVGISDVAAADPESDTEGWYARWLALPDAARNPMRTYTVRAVRPDRRELDIDFVVHGVPAGSALGPAAAWLAQAAPGRQLTVVGPDVRSIHSASGIDWHPGAATEYLLAGDETAVPAVAAILESLAPGARATALLEVGDAADAVPIVTDADVRWIVRDADHRGARLRAAVSRWLDERPAVVAHAAAPAPQPLAEVDVDAELLWETGDGADGGLYAWLAGEAGVIKALRRRLVTELGIDRSRVAFMGYWREGRAEDGT